MYERDAIADPDLTTRAVAVRPNSFDEATRSVEAVLATENPAVVFDMRRFEPIDEILLMPRSDGELPDSLPMLDTHRKASVEDVRGSVRNIRVSGSEMVVRLFFANDEKSTDAMRKVADGHVRNVSVGYRVERAADIAPGKTAQIAGRSFTAGNRVLRVSLVWRAKEGSLVPIGADEMAQIRQDTNAPSQPQTIRVSTMPQALRDYLESIGLARDASDEAARTFYENLSDSNQRRIAEALNTGADQTPPQTATRSETNTDSVPSQSDAGSDAPQTRSAPAAPPADTAPAATATTVEETPEQRGVRLERERVQQIRSDAGDDIPAEVTQRAIDEGWSVERYRTAALRALRDSRSDPPAPMNGRAPAGHSNSRDSMMTVAALTGALMLRERTVDLDYNFRALPLEALGPNFVDVFRMDVNDDERQRAMDNAHRFSGISLVDICRRCCELDGNEVPLSDEEAIQRAIQGPELQGRSSTGALASMFTTNINAELLASYVDAPDSTNGWCDETDVQNFQPHERAAFGKFGALTVHPTGATADHLDVGSNVETSKISRYSGQWVVDEMDLINDRYGAIDQMSPRDIGFSAAQLRPDLVYALIMSNPSLQTTGNAVFGGAGQNNSDTNALNEANLELAISKMMQKRQRNRPLNIRMRYLVVNPQLMFTAMRLITSVERRNPASGGGEGTRNVLASAGIPEGNIRADDRLGPQGVVDPRTGTSYTGSDTTWYGYAQPRENGAKGLVVKYRRGTGRAPTMRSFVLDKGRWGLGWDIKHDIGASFDDWRGVYKGNA